MGVRVTSVIDETCGCGGSESRVWGWSYQTLEGHLEQGELTYEVVKRLRTGAVEFCITSYSKRAPLTNPPDPRRARGRRPADTQNPPRLRQHRHRP
ncbi:DUF1990 family protein [Streptomyces sp. NPDC056240]|uniref:DUF1990 family protein n=1 Tax=Streptomyces sp. NPDC056240 TaxID=3345759 RepID=UPI0035D55A94